MFERLFVYRGACSGMGVFSPGYFDLIMSDVNKGGKWPRL